MEAWCKAEEAHANALKKIASTHNLPAYSETGSTLNTSWQALKLGMLHASRTSETFAKQLKQQASDFVEFRHSQSKVKRSLEAEIKAANKSLNDTKSSTNKLKQKYTAACKTTQANITKRDKMKDDPKAKAESVRKLCAKVDKNMKDVEKTDLSYQAQVDTLNLEEISHREKMDRVLQDLQVVEETRIANTKELLQTISAGAMVVFSTTMEGWGGVTEGVAAIHIQTDIKRFVMKQCSEAAAKGTPGPRLVKTEYESYDSQILDEEGRTSTRIQEQHPPTPSPTTPSPIPSRAPPAMPASGTAPPPASSRAPPPHPAPRSKAPPSGGETKQSSGGPPGMHAPPTATTATTSSSPPGMSKAPPLRTAPLPPSKATPTLPAVDATAGGAAGSAAATAPPTTGPPPPAAAAAPTAAPLVWARATFNFNGAEEDDLKFKEGDLIQIINIEDSSSTDWWKGKLNGGGVLGSFPSNYCQLIFSLSAEPGKMKTGSAKYDFASDEVGEISFKAGDAIEVISMDGEWWEGRCVKGEGVVGLFPSNRVDVD